MDRIDEPHPVAAGAEDERVRARALAEVVHAAQEVAARDAARDDRVMAVDQVVDPEDALDVVDPVLGGDGLAVRVETLRAGAKVQRLVARLLHGERVVAHALAVLTRPTVIAIACRASAIAKSHSPVSRAVLVTDPIRYLSMEGSPTRYVSSRPARAASMTRRESFGRSE